MPEITEIPKQGTTTITANTQLPSALLRSPIPRREEAETVGDPEEDKDKDEEEPKDERLLKARLIQEKIKRQLEQEKRRIASERKQLEIERAQSRKWLEADDLVKQGKYLEAAERAGLSYEQLTQQILNNGQVPPAKVAADTANEVIEKRFEEYKKQQEELQRKQQQKQYADSLKQIETEVKYLVDSSDKYQLAKASESYNDIVKLMESEFHRTGRILPVEEAIKRWEDDALNGLEELAKLESVRSRVFKESPRPNQEHVPTTLSQRTMAPVPAPKALSDAERKQRAIEAFYGRLT